MFSWRPLGSPLPAAGGRGQAVSGTSCPAGTWYGSLERRKAGAGSSGHCPSPRFVTLSPSRSAAPPPLLTRFVHPAACLTNTPFPKPREGKRELGKGRRRRLWILPVAGGRSPGRERRCPDGRLQLQQRQSPEGPARAPAKHCTQRGRPGGEGRRRRAGPPPAPCPASLPLPRPPRRAGDGATSRAGTGSGAMRCPRSDWWLLLSLRAGREGFGFWAVAPPPRIADWSPGGSGGAGAGVLVPPGRSPVPDPALEPGKG